MSSDKPAESPPAVFFSGEEACVAKSILHKIIESSQRDSGLTLDSAGLYKLACEIYQARRERRHCFATSLFGEPAWDMLLYLYCSSARGERPSVSSLCAASDVPPTTALRWVHALEEKGLVERRRHRTDGRSFIVALTQLGDRQMTAYLKRAAQHFPAQEG